MNEIKKSIAKPNQANAENQQMPETPAAEPALTDSAEPAGSGDIPSVEPDAANDADSAESAVTDVPSVKEDPSTGFDGVITFMNGTILESKGITLSALPNALQVLREKVGIDKTIKFQLLREFEISEKLPGSVSEEDEIRAVFHNNGFLSYRTLPNNVLVFKRA